jgi:hypothetical protein
MSESEKEARQELIKHSAAIQIENKITLLQRRTWNVLLYNAYNELDSKEEHQIALQELARFVGYNSHDMEYLKEASVAMLRCIVQYNVLDKDGSLERWGATALLAQAEIEQGLFTYAYSPELRRRLHNPAMYARLDLDLQRQFDSKYGLALWELCADYLGAGREYGETPFIPLDGFRRLMGVAETAYASFKRLKDKVLNPAMAEVNGVSDFRVTVDYQRESRKITALKFKMRRVAPLPAAQNDQGKLFPDLDDMPAAVRELKDAGVSVQDALDLWQQGFGCVQEKVRPAGISEDPEAAFVQYIREKIHLLKRRQAAGTVKNSTGFLLDAIKKNFANPEFARERKARDRKTKARERERLEEQKRQAGRRHEEALHAHCARMIEASPALLDEAVAALREKHPAFWAEYVSGETPPEDYRERPSVYVPVENFLARRYPERFQALHAARDAELAELDGKIAALEQAV